MADTATVKVVLSQDAEKYVQSVVARAVAAEGKLGAVRAKHYDVRATALSNGEAYAAMRRICNSCRQAWPCETRRIVDGVTA